MMGLVDYGSDSGSDSDDEGASGVLVQNPKKGISVPIASGRSTTIQPQVDNSTEDGEDGLFSTDEPVLEGSSILSLPAARSLDARKSDEVHEEDIEDIVKPKEWEKKLAKKERKKLEKKAAKRAEKDKRKAEKKERKAATEKGDMEKKKRGPVKIAAFGGLNKHTALDEEEEKDVIQIPTPAVSTSAISLFSMLPPPKPRGKDSTVKAPTLLVPHTLRNKKNEPAKSVPIKPTLKPSRIVSGVESSDDEDDGDFFGLSSKEETVECSVPVYHNTGVPILPSYGLSVQAGPDRPDDDAPVGYASAVDEEEDTPGPSTQSKLKQISNEQAQNLIFKHDYAPWGYDRRQFADTEIIDVNVDAAIGPNVHENLLKNLNHQTITKLSLPNIPTTGDVKDKNAKRKHQITYLANLAVAREEALQQKWAEGKAAKRMARQKYGF